MKNNDQRKDKLFRVFCKNNKATVMKYIHASDTSSAKRKFNYLYGKEWKIVDIKIARRSFKPKITIERKVL